MDEIAQQLSLPVPALSAALMGGLADLTSLKTVYHLCAYLPLLGLLTWFLPTIERPVTKLQ